MSDGTALYLDLLKLCLTNFLQGHAEERPVRSNRRFKQWIVDVLAARGIRMVRPAPFDPALRAEGKDWPPNADSMIGLRRLDNLQFCIEDALTRKVPGDLIETGVWRGGATIFMRAVLKAHGVSDRLVWVADSFEGLPPPDEKQYPQDRGDRHHAVKELAISLEEVQSNFRRYGLLDEQVRFVKGWFRDTLPRLPIERLAVLRLDGDMYESTMDALVNLYPKLSEGGYVIVDDYGAIPACRQAVHDFRDAHGIGDEIQKVDWTGVYWQRGSLRA
jgi:O-methyltransferase